MWGLSISGPVTRLVDERLHEFGDAVRLAAEEVSVSMGAQGAVRSSDGSANTTGAQARKQGLHG
jgi:hypothetical protein